MVRPRPRAGRGDAEPNPRTDRRAEPTALPPTPVLGMVLPDHLDDPAGADLPADRESPAYPSYPSYPDYGDYGDDGGPHTMSMPAIRLDGHVASDSSSLTIGVVLDIPEPWASYLQSARESFGDLQARAIPTHVTLLPPTSVPLERVDEIVDHLACVAGGLRPFDVLLDGTDTFRPISPVVFVRVASGGDGCDAVQAAVRTGPLQRDLTFPFHPHVTVAHHLDDDALDRAAKELTEFSAAFEVNAFVLYEHGPDHIWRPRRRFGFGAGPA